jgi:hypothetical protein
MKWEISDNRPNIGDVRFKTRFAWLPTRVLSKITYTDHIIWLQLYVSEEVYKRSPDGWEADWYTIGRTIHL